MTGRIASFHEIARICAEARSHVFKQTGGAGFNSQPTGYDQESAKQGMLRRVAAESTRRLKAAGIAMEGA